MGFVFINEQTALQGKNLVQTHPEIAASLRKKAEEWLEHPTLSVTFHASRAASGNPHDYYSEGPYWWPNPEDPDGPYIRKDGYRNPNSCYQHHRDFSELAYGVRALSLAGYHLDTTKYFDKALELLRVWFLDEETKMNPHLNYGQAIPGICTGRGIGIIELSALDIIVHALGYLESYPKAEETIAGLKVWMGEMLDWLLNSPYGIDESIHGNNHETWWNVHVLSVAAYLGMDAEVKELLKNYHDRILTNQMQPDGSMPLELERTRSLHYSLFNLKPMALICEIALQYGINMWDVKTVDGKCLEKGIDFILPYIENWQAWPYEELDDKPIILDRLNFL